MNEKQIKAFLKSALASPSSGAVERCIVALPPIRSRSILPLIGLQLRSLPVSMYVLALGVIGVQLRLVMTMEASDALTASGIAGSLVALLLAWHLTLAVSGGMTELERCCRYSYGQILLSRVLCLCLLTGGGILAAAIPGAVHHGLGFRFVMLALLPTASGALCAMLFSRRRRSTDLTLMIVYLIASMVTSLNLTVLSALPTGALLMVLLITASLLFSQTNFLLTRSIDYEADTY